MDYIENIQAQARNLLWAEQVENGKIQDPFLSYTSLKDVTLETVNKACSQTHVCTLCIRN